MESQVPYQTLVELLSDILVKNSGGNDIDRQVTMAMHLRDLVNTQVYNSIVTLSDQVSYYIKNLINCMISQREFRVQVFIS